MLDLVTIFSESLNDSFNGNYTETVNVNYTETVNGNYTETVNGNYTETINGNYTETVNGNYTETFSGTPITTQKEPTTTPKLTCNQLKGAFSNVTFMYPGFFGIPETYFVNFFVFIVFFFLFAIAKYYAWKRCQSGNLHIYQLNLLQTLYGDSDLFILKGAPRLSTINLKIGPQTTSVWKFLKWFVHSFHLSTNEIIKRCGNDTYLYLAFEKHLIIFYFFNTCIALCMILPANIIETLSTKENGTFEFSQTTMAEINENTNFLWVHIFVTAVTLLLISAVMKAFSNILLKGEEINRSNRRTLMISKLPRKFRRSIALRSYFLNIYPEAIINNIRMVYNYAPLLKICQEMVETEDSLLFCKFIYKKYRSDIIVKKHCWFNFFYFHCDCGCAMAYGRQFYTQRMKNLRSKFLCKLSEVMKCGPTKAFISFTDVDVTEIVRFAEKRKEEILDQYWSISNAPLPSNILWNYIATQKSEHKAQIILVLIVLFVVSFFLTTPNVLIKFASSIPVFKIFKLNHSMTANFISSCFTLLMTLSLYPIVDALMSFIPFETKSSQIMSVTKMLYMLLVLCFLVMPVIDLTSIYNVINAFVKDDEKSFRYGCLYLSENGAFFINYIITAAFMGNLSLLLRAGSFCFSIFELICSYSEADKIKIYKALFCETTFGAQYAYILLHFTIINFYSTPIPLIAPFGFFYMCIKYYVDRHTIYYSYKPTKTGLELHYLAIKLVYFNILFKNVGFFILLFGKTAWNDARVIVMLIVLIITILIFIYNLNLRIFRTCHAYTSKQFLMENYDKAELEDEEDMVYFPSLLETYMNVIDEI